MRFVVTGASGHLGVNVVRALVAAGEPVRAVDVRPSAALAGLPAEFVRADVLDPAALRNAFAGGEFVLHLAARISIAGDPDGSMRRVNVEGVRNVAEAALEVGIRRLVHCSSLHAYDVGAIRGPVRENGLRATDSRLPAYDRSKAEGEAELRRVFDRGLDAVILNPSGMIGPVDPEPSRMGRVLLAMFKGRMPIAVAGAMKLVQLAAAAAVGLAGPRRAGRMLLTPESLHALATDPVVDSSKAIAELRYRPRCLAETVADLHALFVAEGRVRSPPR